MSDPDPFGLPPSNSPGRRQLFESVSLMASGTPVIEALHAYADLLASGIGFLADDLVEADALLDRLLPDLKERLRVYWPTIQAAKARGLHRKPWRSAE